MKLLYLLNILFLVTPGLASLLAGPYQTVFFWYAYQLEVVQYGPTGTLTGKGCRGTGAGGSCYFDEFVKYIERTGKKAGFKKSTGVGTNLTPAVLDTVSKLNAAGYTNQLEPGKLLPNNFHLGESPDFQKVVSPVMKNIDDTRQDMIKSGKDETTSTQLANIRTALTGVLDGRREENSDNMLKAFDEFKVENGLTFTNEFSDHTALDGHTYQMLDPEKIKTNNPNIANNFKNKISEFPDYFQTLIEKDGGGARHFNAILAAESFTIQAYDPMMCSSP